MLQAAGYSEASKLVIDAPVWYQRNNYRELMVPMYQKLPEIDFRVRQVDNPTAVQMLNDRNYEDTMNITFGPPVYAVDQALYPFYHSKAGLNHNNVSDAEMDRLVTAQRSEQNAERQKELWKQAEDRIYDQVWQILFPVGGFRRTFWHNYVINLRPHGISAVLNCYGDAKIRSLWLDEGAPQAVLMPNGDIKTKQTDGVVL
jgi:ABC-type transport system substrate-binding protein